MYAFIYLYIYIYRSGCKLTFVIISCDNFGFHRNCIRKINLILGILHMGDGTNIYLKNQPLKVHRILGYDGEKRDIKLDCNGNTNDINGMPNMIIEIDNSILIIYYDLIIY